MIMDHRLAKKYIEEKELGRASSFTVNICYLRTQKTRIEIIFGFSLYAVFLQVILVVYFRRVLGKLRELGPLKGSKVCYC